MFFTYRQNNPRGRFIGAKYVIVEAESAKEAKLVYESIITSFSKKAETKSAIKESVGFASKAVGMITNSGAKVIETDAQYNRWEKLAFGK